MGLPRSVRGTLVRLSPRQRAILVLRDVLGFSARETAEVLESSIASVNSALQRARVAVEAEEPAHGRAVDEAARTAEGEEATLVARYLRAWDAADVDGLVALLREDARMTMPPTPSWYAGREAIGAFFHSFFAGALGGRTRLVPTRANRQPALAVYAAEEGPTLHALAVEVLTLEGGKIAAITGFADPMLFPFFGPPLVRELGGPE